MSLKKLPEGDELTSKCEESGIDLTGDPITGSISGRRKADQAELQKRLLNFYAHKRNERLWIIALLSSIASVLSAVAAWIAIAMETGK